MSLIYYEIKDYIELLRENNLLVEANLAPALLDKRVRYVSYDSNDVEYNTVFICKGAHFLEKYLQSALENGAMAYISEEKYNIDAPNIIVNDIRRAMAVIANFYYNKIWKKITLIGITGTKGKSTTSYFMKYILDSFLKDMDKKESAIISGIDNYDGVICEESHLTTPEAFMFHKHMYNAVKSDIEYLTMEVSSQALKYHRTKDVIYNVGAFLNIGTDHISDIEHPDFEDYLKSKLVLFDQTEICVINSDGEYGETFINAAKNGSKTKKLITFSTEKKASITAYNIVPSRKGIKFMVKSDSFDEEFKISMTGLFNVSNALAAIAIGYGLNIPIGNIKDGLRKAKVSGRMESFTNSKENIHVLVDYAHNQMSFQSLFESTKKEYPDKKIIIVFGCPGKKALGRRKELGEIAGKYADLSILTEEDAGEEPITKISEEIAKNIEAVGGRYQIINNREEAIKRAIEGAHEDSIILITGKGRETRQKRGTEYIDTPSDVDYVEKYLRLK